MNRSNATGASARGTRLRLSARRPLVAAITMGLLLGSASIDLARAADASWTGAASTDWNVAANWTAPPASDSNIFIDTAIPNATGLNASAAEIYFLTVGATDYGQLDITHGGTLTVTGSDSNSVGMFVGRDSGSNGSVTVDGTGSTLTVAAGTQIGNAGTGSLSVLNGGTASLGLTDAYTEVLLGFGNYGHATDAADGVGTVTVDGAGSTLTYAGGMNVLNGSLMVSNGGLLISQSRATDPGWVAEIGFGMPANPDGSSTGMTGTGHVTVSGAGSAWTGVNALQMGLGGDGTLSVLDGGTATFTGFADLGGMTHLYVFDGSSRSEVASQTGSGYVFVSGAGSKFAVEASSDSTGYINVGYDGPGQLTVADGGTVTAPGGIWLGSQGGMTIGGQNEDGSLRAPGTVDTPTITLEDPAAWLQLQHNASDYTLAAAISGSGNIFASGGFTRLSGDSSAFTGGTSIDGGATLDVTGKLGGALYVGNTGAGTLQVTDGGSVHATGGTNLAYASGSSGDIVVSGAGSTFVVDGSAQIGYAGTGSLSVLDGGTASLGLTDGYTEVLLGFGNYGYATDAANGVGTVTVDGAGSTLTYAGGMNVLNGSLTVSDGGQLVSQTRAGEETVPWLDFIGYGQDANADKGTVNLDGVGQVTITGTGSAWNSVNGLSIGQSSTGSLAVLDGSTASFHGGVTIGDALRVALPSGEIVESAKVGHGDVVVSGSGSTFTIGAASNNGGPGAMYLAESGEGSLSVSNGGLVAVADTLSIGGTDASVGVLDIESGGSMTVGGSDSNLIGMLVGRDKGSNGNVIVNGAGSVLTVKAGAQIGNAGTGNLSVTGGGTVNLGLDTAYSETLLGFTYYGWGADAADGIGFVAVDGAGSTLNYAGGLNVLNGAVTITDGGQVVSHARAGDGTAFWIDQIGWGVPANPDGSFDGLAGSGYVTVSGAGSAWSSGNALDVGNGGDGSLSILDGGKATFTGFANLSGISYLYDAIGGSPVPDLAGRTGSGYVFVSGAGSALTIAAIPDNTTWGTGYINVGYDGPGGLTVADGGTVTAPGGIWVGAQGAVIVGGTREDDSVAAAGVLDTPFINLQQAGSSLLLQHSSTDYTLAAAISGVGNIFAEGGFTRLSGDSSAFTGNISIDNGATLDVTGKLGGGLYVGNTGAGSLQVTDGGSVHAIGSTNLAYASGSSGDIVVSGAGSTFVVDAGTQIGNAGAGSLSVLDGGTASLGLDTAYVETVLGFGYYGHATDAADGVGTVVVDGAGSTLTYAGGMNVLNGALIVSNGGHLVSHSRAGEGTTSWLDFIGYAQDANADRGLVDLNGTGVVTITGAGSMWDSVNGLDIGQSSTGSMAILDGAAAAFHGTVTIGDVLYAMAPGGEILQSAKVGHAKLTVAGEGSTFTLAAVPEGGTGGAGTMYLAESGEGSLSVSEGGSVAVADTLSIGGTDASKGALDIESGGSMTVGGSDSNLIGMLVGRDKGSDGNVIVNGADSVLSVAAGAQIGNAGTGNLSVTGGGTVNLGLDTAYSETLLGFTYYGWGADAADGTGFVDVDGAGSTLNYAGGLNVLNGAVNIADGGQMVSHARAGDGTTFWLDTIGWGVPANPDGSFAGLTGNSFVTVSGAGSAWSSGNALHMGDGGNGSLAIIDGGTATFTGFADLGGISYLYDSIGGSPVPDVAGQTGSGTVLVSGAGSALTIAAVPGNTTWGTGAIDVGVDGTGSLTVNDGGTVTAPGGIHLGAHGTLLVGGPSGNGSLAAPGTIAAPTMTFDAPTSTLTFQHSGALYIFDTAMSGNGHIDAIGGFTRLTADSSAFTGTTTVDSGATLSVNGSLGGDILVTTEGTLQGTGTVQNVTVAGTLAPGNSPGTLHVNGDLVMQTGSVYQAQIDPQTGVSDSVAVAGNVTIQPGTTLDIQNLGSTPLTPGANIQLIQTTSDTGTVAGQFDNTVGSVSAFVGYGVTYENGQINVGVTRSETSFASVGSTPGAKALGTALDGVSDTSALGLLLFTQIATPEQATAAFKAMGGTMNADLHRVLLDDSRLPRDTVDRHLRQAADTAGEGTAYWVQAMGHWGSHDSHGDMSGARANGSGLMVGVDTGVGDITRLGVAAGSSQTSYDMQAQNAHAKSKHLALYGRSLLGGFGVDYGVASTWHDIHGQRSFMVGSTPQALNSDHDARADQAFVDAGYRVASGRGYAEPFVSMAHVVLHNDAATESGSATALSTRSSSDVATFSTLGLRWASRSDAALWYGSLGWRHVFGFERTVATQSFAAGGSAFETVGLPMARNAIAVELGTRFAVSRNVHVEAGYTGLVAAHARDHGARITVSVDL